MRGTTYKRKALSLGAVALLMGKIAVAQAMEVTDDYRQTWTYPWKYLMTEPTHTVKWNTFIDGSVLGTHGYDSNELPDTFYIVPKVTTDISNDGFGKEIKKFHVEYKFTVGNDVLKEARGIALELNHTYLMKAKVVRSTDTSFDFSKDNDAYANSTDCKDGTVNLYALLEFSGSQRMGRLNRLWANCCSYDVTGLEKGIVFNCSQTTTTDYSYLTASKRYHPWNLKVVNKNEESDEPAVQPQQDHHSHLHLPHIHLPHIHRPHMPSVWDLMFAMMPDMDKLEERLG